MKLALLIPVLFLWSHAVTAQVTGNWELGISGLTGRDFYDRKYYHQPELPPGKIADIKSNYLWAGGFWVEKRLNQHIAAIGELRFTEVDIPNNTLCECSYTGVAIFEDEKHYWGLVGLNSNNPST